MSPAPVESRVGRLVRANLEFHALNKAGETKLGLSLVQYHVLGTLRHMPGCSPRALARAAGIDPSSLTQTLKRLHRKGALVTVTDPKDSRRKILSMTRAGRELLDRFDQGAGALLKAAP